MLEDIKEMLMVRMNKKRNLFAVRESIICPRIQVTLEKFKDANRWWRATGNGVGVFQVRSSNEGYVVDLPKRSCTCRSRDSNGIPCVHAIATIREAREEPEASMIAIARAHI